MSKGSYYSSSYIKNNPQTLYSGHSSRSEAKADLTASDNIGKGSIKPQHYEMGKRYTKLKKTGLGNRGLGDTHIKSAAHNKSYYRVMNELGTKKSAHVNCQEKDINKSPNGFDNAITVDDLRGTTSSGTQKTSRMGKNIKCRFNKKKSVRVVTSLLLKLGIRVSLPCFFNAKASPNNPRKRRSLLKKKILYQAAKLGSTNLPRLVKVITRKLRNYVGLSSYTVRYNSATWTNLKKGTTDTPQVNLTSSAVHPLILTLTNSKNQKPIKKGPRVFRRGRSPTIVFSPLINVKTKVKGYFILIINLLRAKYWSIFGNKGSY